MSQADAKIFGSVEPVELIDWGVEALAKIDTGAYSGAIHVEDLRLERIDGEKVLIFRPLGAESPEVTVSKFSRRVVRSALGHEEQRYLVPIRVRVGDKTYTSTMGITNRENMTYPIIIGRRFLHRYHILVDVKRNQHDLTDEGEH